MIVFIIFLLPGFLLLLFVVIQFFFRGDAELKAVDWRITGRCPSCGYDLQQNISGVCPECGAQVPPKT